MRERSINEYVFPDRNIRARFPNALRDATIKNFRFHDLRHTFASHLVMNGVDLIAVKELLGHKSIKMTMKYAHLSQSHKNRAVDVLGNVMDTIWTQSSIAQPRVTFEDAVSSFK